MKIIGITGGVGAGKSEVLREIEKLVSCRIIIADEAAHDLEQPGAVCYQPLIELLGKEILNPDQTIHNGKMAAKIFGDASGELLKKVNQLVHPAVKRYIFAEIDREKQLGSIDYFIIEAALLIEDGYVRICDELWYVYASEEVRRKRLHESRGYLPEKIDGIMKAQADEATFRRYCKVVIDNNGDKDSMIRQLKAQLS